jgi:hypothetical protein
VGEDLFFKIVDVAGPLCPFPVAFGVRGKVEAEKDEGKGEELAGEAVGFEKGPRRGLDLELGDENAEESEEPEDS